MKKSLDGLFQIYKIYKNMVGFLPVFWIFFVQCVVQVIISLTNERRGPKRSYKKEGILRRLQIFRVPYSIPSERIRKKDYMTFFAISNLLLPKSWKERDFFEFKMCV